jgi:hypothetical protein
MKTPLAVAAFLTCIHTGMFVLGALQLCRAYAWWSAFGPYEWLWLASFYAGTCVVGGSWTLWVISGHRSEYRFSTIVSAQYLVLSMLSSGLWAVFIGIYYYHYNGVAPTSQNAWDTNAPVREAHWIGLMVLDIVFTFTHLTIFVTSLVTKYWMQGKLRKVVSTTLYPPPPPIRRRPPPSRRDVENPKDPKAAEGEHSSGEEEDEPKEKATKKKVAVVWRKAH